MKNCLSVLCVHEWSRTLPELSVVSVCRRKKPSLRELTDTPKHTHTHTHTHTSSRIVHMIHVISSVNLVNYDQIIVVHTYRRHLVLLLHSPHKADTHVTLLSRVQRTSYYVQWSPVTLCEPLCLELASEF